MRILAIETAGEACSIALIEDEAIIAERHELVGRGHAERLIPWISQLPDGGRADQIIVSCGPGSFTGVRIGIAAARGLGLGWGVPVLGVSSLALLAATVTSPKFSAVIEAGHGELFVQSFAASPLQTAGSLCSLTIESAVEQCTDEHVIGNGAARLNAARGFGTQIEAEARAANVLLLPAAFMTLPPTPIYGREADAKPMAAR